ncbi:hypothetical protein FB451DRAFT_1164026 [Mycena latifolia]|nr:hypothetical protein FB451DRAFT_1164026 [Mycena latifolia]
MRTSSLLSSALLLASTVAGAVQELAGRGSSSVGFSDKHYFCSQISVASIGASLTLSLSLSASPTQTATAVSAAYSVYAQACGPTLARQLQDAMAAYSMSIGAQLTNPADGEFQSWTKQHYPAYSDVALVACQQDAQALASPDGSAPSATTSSATTSAKSTTSTKTTGTTSTTSMRSTAGTPTATQTPAPTTSSNAASHNGSPAIYQSPDFHVLARSTPGLPGVTSTDSDRRDSSGPLTSMS